VILNRKRCITANYRKPGFGVLMTEKSIFEKQHFAGSSLVISCPEFKEMNALIKTAGKIQFLRFLLIDP